MARKPPGVNEFGPGARAGWGMSIAQDQIMPQHRSEAPIDLASWRWATDQATRMAKLEAEEHLPVLPKPPPQGQPMKEEQTSALQVLVESVARERDDFREKAERYGKMVREQAERADDLAAKLKQAERALEEIAGLEAAPKMNIGRIYSAGVAAGFACAEAIARQALSSIRETESI